MKTKQVVFFVVGMACCVFSVFFCENTRAQSEQAQSEQAKIEKSTDAKLSREVLHKLTDGVIRFSLDNGLRVLIYRRSYAPVFSGQIWVKVGGVNEVPGLTGAAHLLEHMAFKGSKVIGTKDYSKEEALLAKVEAIMQQVRREQGNLERHQQELAAIYSELSSLWNSEEFSKIYQRQGSVGLNAGTSKDYTMYQVELPSSAFELWCWMESDRLLNPVFRQFYKEREVVGEERRMRTDDDPGGLMYEALLATAYRNHPNRLPVVGWASDIRKLTATDTALLHKKYYRADNMVVSLVGDLDPAKIKPLLEKYFGRLPKPEGPLDEVIADEEPQRGAREAVVEFDAEPTFAMAYHKPAFPNPDDIYFSVLHSLLSGGRSSILHKDLVLKRQLALSVGTYEAPGSLYPSLFIAQATPRQGVSNLMLRDEIQKIFDRLKIEEVSDADFAAAKKRVRLSFLSGMDSNDDLASTLAHAELLWGDWRSIFKMYDQLNEMKKSDVMRLAKTYFNVSNRTYVHLEKLKKEKVEGLTAKNVSHSGKLLRGAGK